MKSWKDSRRYLKLSTFDEILSRIQNRFVSYVPKTESSRADLALGRICAENVTSITEIPERSISAMDGYAVISNELTSASPTNPNPFTVKGSIFAGHTSRLPSLNSGETYYVATGAPLPIGADAVVRVEEALPFHDNRIMVRHPIEKGKNIANRGEDVRKGQTVIQKGHVLNPTDVALLIGAGRTHIKVYKTLSIGLLSIGNELTEFDPSRGAKLGRCTVNNYLNLLSGYVSQFGSKPISLGTCSDDASSIRHAILLGLKKCDAVLTISGSSVGRHDNVLATLKAIQGTNVLFHGVRVVPIRPAGVVITRQKPVVMIPGHAVSALLAFFVIALPILNMMTGLTLQSRKAVINAQMKDEIANERAIDALWLVKLVYNESGRNYNAIPLSWGSNLMSNLSQADGFAWLSPRQTILEGQTVTVQLLNGTQVAKSAWSFPLN